jgi:hypothetical protein
MPEEGRRALRPKRRADSGPPEFPPSNPISHRGDGVDSAERLLAKAVSILTATGQKPSREQVLLAALKLGIGFYGIDSFRASAEKLPFSWELDRAARDVHDRPHPHGAKNGRQLQLEI